MIKKSALFVVSFMLANGAVAATKGSYVGIDFVNSRAKFYETISSDTGPTQNKKPSSVNNDNYGVGLSYKYAFNNNGVFVAPGVFAEYNNVDVQGVRYSSIGQNQSLDITSRFGAKVDIGFDIGKYVSPYISGGYNGINYKTRNVGNDSIESYGYRCDTSGAFFYGGGLKFDLGNNVALNVEYNIQNFNPKTKIVNNTHGLKAEYNVRFDVLKAGFSYNF